MDFWRCWNIGRIYFRFFLISLTPTTKAVIEKHVFFLEINRVFLLLIQYNYLYLTNEQTNKDMNNPTNEELQNQLKRLNESIGKSWIGDDHITAKIQDIEQELNRRELTNKNK